VINYIIVTNSINRSKELVERNLKASLNQSIKPLKVILIDQNETPLALSENVISSPLFERQFVNKKSVSAARNSLIIPFEAEWIFFCDDDGYPCEKYSEILSDLILSFPYLEIFAGSIVRDDNLQYYSIRHKKGGNLKYFRNTKLLMGSNFVVKVDVFNRLDRFDESFGAGTILGSSEETDFCWKAFFNGIKMDYFPSLIVYHVPPFTSSLKGGFMKSFRYGIGKGALIYKWLFQKHKVVVTYELIEMLIVPFFKSFIGIIQLRPFIVINSFAGFLGRIYGLLMAPLYLK
jgi:GT2 family glycosyltransferase